MSNVVKFIAVMYLFVVILFGLIMCGTMVIYKECEAQGKQAMLIEHGIHEGEFRCE